jgi:TM2 domain-containing membrane protein YozV
MTENSHEHRKEEAVKKADEMFCPSCGEIIKKEAELCMKCGVRVKSPLASLGHELNELGGDKNKLVAGLLGIFLGSFGAHKFYLGKGGTAMWYVCFCWTGIPALIGIIEGISYLSMTEAAFAKKFK